jgi:glycosyltransferase involved in cell wall biosynthesis
MRFGFVATRIAGVDGVSLETMKLSDVLRRLGHETFFCAGELDKQAQPGMEVPEFHFHHPEARAIHDDAFSGMDESRALYQHIAQSANSLKDKLYEFVEAFQLDGLITQNAQAIPMQIPLGVALRDFIDETHIPTIAHLHDFYWERERFLVNRIPDILRTAFPSEGTSMRHMVISTAMQRELYIRRKLNAVYLPNVFDFATPPAPPDDYAANFRADLGIGPEALLVLQPTRIIRRKNIERAVDLTRMLGEQGFNPVLVVTGYAGDEVGSYYEWLRQYTDRSGIRALFIGDRITEFRGMFHGQRTYRLWDVYPSADIISYLSSYEGFGNALIETLYFRKPLVVNAYIPYRSDIGPAGVQAVEIHEDVTPETVQAVRDLLHNPAAIQSMVEHNYQIGREQFSYEVLEQRLQTLIASFPQA